MMNRIFLLLSFCSLLSVAKAQELSCRYGFGYEISNSPNWGKDKLVITSVYANTPAQKAGIKRYDIIEEVDGIPITENELDDIYLFLNPEGKDIVELTIKNITDGARKVKIDKECKSLLALSEYQLSTAFSMYAVEYAHERLFSCPFVTSTTKEPVDFADFKTFGFFASNDGQPALALKINELIRKELTDRGLKYDPSKPDLLVHIYYSLTKNRNYKPKTPANTSKDAEKVEYVYRYDITNDRMVKLPFLPPDTNESETEYFLKLGFRLEDHKFVTGRIIWESEINELSNESFSLEEFALVHIPLMSLQYPYVKYGRNVQFRLMKKVYNYTGINFSIDNIAEITSVDPYSPAAVAGIRPYDRLDAINDKRMDRTVKQFTNAYHNFLVNTLPYKDANTRFTDANGFPDCMYWDTLQYPLIIKAFNNKKNLTAFSYLFNFAPFINPSGANTCSLKLRRDKEKLEYILRPEVRTEITLLIY